MANNDQLERKHRRACQRVQAFLHARGGIPISIEEVKNFGQNYTSGWKIECTFSGAQQLSLAVLVSGGFPVTPPRLALFDPPPLLSWPHLEEYGLLCIFQNALSYDINQPEAVVSELLLQGTQLLQNNLDGNIASELQREFVSYWNRAVTSGQPEVRSLLSFERRHRHISTWTDGQSRIVANDQKEIKRWLTNRNIVIKESAFDKGALLWIDSIPTPEEFPITAVDLYRMVQNDQEALRIIGTLCEEGGKAVSVIIGVETNSGIGLGALRVLPPPFKGAPNRRFDPVTKGFRLGRISPIIAAQRVLAHSTRVLKAQVDRIDHSWIHGRDSDSRQLILKDSKIVLVGVGSLGSTVAKLLAKAGVGSLTLIDPDTLKWENLSRHELGSTSVGKSKSTQLALELRNALPHLTNIEGIPEKLEIGSLGWDACNDAHLIISTTGDWQIESLLNELHRAGQLPPVQFSWLETHAAAAHSVLIADGEFCLQCGMGPAGQMHRPVSAWLDEGLIQVPACGGVFSPYGAVELAYCHGLVAEHAIDYLLGKGMKKDSYRVWIGRIERWVDSGGKITQAWLDAYGHPGEGGQTFHLNWQHDTDCPVCRRRTIA